MQGQPVEMQGRTSVRHNSPAQRYAAAAVGATWSTRAAPLWGQPVCTRIHFGNKLGISSDPFHWLSETWQGSLRRGQTFLRHKVDRLLPMPTLCHERVLTAKTGHFTSHSLSNAQCLTCGIDVEGNKPCTVPKWQLPSGQLWHPLFWQQPLPSVRALCPDLL